MAHSLDRLTVDSVRAYVTDLLQAFLDHAQVGRGAGVEFNQDRFVLECLPLSTDEFATATNRLANARSYLRAGERGAARFELWLLLRSMETGTSQARNDLEQSPRRQP